MIEVSANRTSPMLTHIAQTVADIVHRAADIIAEHIFFTVTNGQCRFGKLDGHAGQRDQPYPEKGIRSAEADRRGYTRDIAGADYGGHGGHQRVERGNVACIVIFPVAALHHPEGEGNAALCHETVTDRQKNPVPARSGSRTGPLAKRLNCPSNSINLFLLMKFS